MSIEIISGIYSAGFIIWYLASYILAEDRNLSTEERFLLIKVCIIWPLVLLVAVLETWVDIFSTRKLR